MSINRLSLIRITLLGIVVFTFMDSIMSLAKASDEYVTVSPTENQDVFKNPHMGWVYIDNAVSQGQHSSQYHDMGVTKPYINDGTDFEYFSDVAVLSYWAALEPKDNVYDWELFDQVIEYWISKDKKIQLRFMTDPLIMHFGRWSKGAPDWIYELGVPSRELEEWGIPYKVPDYNHPIYKKKLREFMNAFASHLSKYDDHIVQIDLRGYGAWGEWHSGYLHDNMRDHVRALKGIIDSWYEPFENWMGEGRYMVLSDSYEYRKTGPSGFNTKCLPYFSVESKPLPKYVDFVKNSAFDYAEQHKYMTFRRDGVSAYMRDHDALHLRYMYMVHNRPVTLEIAGVANDFKEMKRWGFDIQSALDEAVMYHPNYMIAWGWDAMGFIWSGFRDPIGAVGFYNNHQDYVKQGLQEMGYRLVGTLFRYPSRIASDSQFTIKHRWENRANGRLFVKYYPAFYLMRDGEVCHKFVDQTWSPQNIVRGEIYEHITRFDLPSLKNGVYDLRVALVNKHGEPSINLGMQICDEGKRYLVGQVTIDNNSQRLLPTYGRVEDWESNDYEYKFTKHSRLSVTQDEVISGGNSVVGFASHKSKDTLILRSAKIDEQFKNGHTYKVSFMYKRLEEPGYSIEEPGYLWFRADSVVGSKRKEQVFVKVFADSDCSGSKTTIFKMNDLDTNGGFLTWGLYRGGKVAIDHIEIEDITDQVVSSNDFESGTGSWQLGEESTIEREEKSNNHAVMCRMKYNPETRSPNWSLIMTNNDVLLANTTYTVKFDYRQFTNACFGSHLVFQAESESKSNENCGVLRFTEINNHLYDHCYQKTITFTTGNVNDLKLKMLLKNGGECSIDNIIVIKEN